MDSDAGFLMLPGGGMTVRASSQETSGNHFMDYLSMKNLPLTQATVRRSTACSLTIARIEHAPNDGIWFDPIDDLVISIVLRSDCSRVTRDVGKGRREIRYRPGSILITPAATPSYWRFDGQPHVLHLSLPWRSALTLVEPAAGAVDAIEKIAPAPLRDPLIAGLAKRIWTAEDAGIANPRTTERTLGMILDLVLFEPRRPRPPPSPGTRLSRRQLSKVLEIMADQKLMVSVGELATGLGFSTDHFIRSFKAATGRSPGQMIRDLSLEAAMTQLRRGQSSMTDIAMELGFSSPSHFSAFFKARTGTSPKEWLAKSRLS